MKFVKFFSLLFLTTALTFIFLFFNKVYAQSVSLSLSPPLLEVFIKPGKTIMVAYNLQNYGDPVICQAKVLPFEPKDNYGNIRIRSEFEGPIRFSLDNADLKLDQPFFLKSKGRQQILLRLRVPERAPEGDYYYTLLVETQPPPVNEGKASGRAKVTIGSNILVTVTGSETVQIKGKIALFDVLPRFKLNLGFGELKIFDSNDKIPVVAVVENQGRNFIKPEGEIILRGNFGETAKYNILPQNILSQSQRLLSATPSAQIDCGNEKKMPIFCQKPVSLLLSGFFIGKYNLSLSIFFGENTPKLFASTSFIALPFKLIFGFLIALFIAFFIIKKISND